eukprot:359550-Prymnesium_polylepis.1
MSFTDSVSMSEHVALHTWRALPIAFPVLPRARRVVSPVRDSWHAAGKVGPLHAARRRVCPWHRGPRTKRAVSGPRKKKVERMQSEF